MRFKDISNSVEVSSLGFVKSDRMIIETKIKAFEGHLRLKMKYVQMI